MTSITPPELEVSAMPAQSRRMDAALKQAGGDARYTEFPDAGHNAWDAAYATPALWDWLFAQHRRGIDG